MKIAVLSGKGGTGKTLISVNLAAVSEGSIYVDCDVEEPNGHLFFKPEIVKKTPVTVLLPKVDKEKCRSCRVCVDFCAFHALAFIKEKPLLFPEVCHSCGGCSKLCPEQAISEVPYDIGEIKKGVSDSVTVLSGTLEPGNASGTPVLHQLFQELEKEESKVTILDCPPGTACMTMESIEDADYCILVAEPTIFGAHNLEMVFELVKKFNKPFGAVLNKSVDGENPSEVFCSKNSIPILQNIPFDRELGTMNSNGEIVSKKSEHYKNMFSTLLNRVYEEVEDR